MSRKAIWILCGVAVSALMSGCATQTEMAMKFAQGDAAVYKVTTETIKDYKFEQPSLEPPKVKEDQSATVVTATFQQQVESVDAKGNAVANVTIKGVAYAIKDKDVVKFEYDSGNTADAEKPFAKVIGQVYKISISPDGKVTVLDANAARAAVAGSTMDARVAKSFFSDEAIAKRHEVLCLPEAGKAVAVGGTWERVVPPPPGLLAPKSYKKVYTLTKIEGPKGKAVAYVDMKGAESPVQAEGAADQAASSMGPFAKMFDTEETYTGSLEFDLAAGRVRKQTEKLVVTYIAAEAPADQKPNVGPDKLTMRLTYGVDVQAVTE